MNFRQKALSIASIATIGSGIIACGSNEPSSSKNLNSAGATFPSKIYTRWFSDLAKSGGAKVNYQAVGSGTGRKAFIDQTVDFAASDDPMKAKDIAKVARGLVQIPMVGGTVAFGYNKPDCELQLSQKQAVRIAMGKVKDWSEIGCPSQKLMWVHRSDGSGTTKAFTNSMQAFSKEWTLGTGKSVKWPAGIGGKGNAGVASVIRQTPGAIGYINQSYIKGNIRAAALQNLSGQFVKPTSETGAAALNNIKLNSDLAGTNPNPSARDAYPITTLTWILAYETGNGLNALVIQETLNNLLSEQYQSKAKGLGFVPLQGEILKKARTAVKRIRN